MLLSAGNKDVSARPDVSPAAGRATDILSKILSRSDTVTKRIIK